MNKFLISFFSIVIFSCGVAFASYSGSISSSTITCSVTLSSPTIPAISISHVPLTSVTTNYAVINGTVTSANVNIDNIYIFYYQDGTSVSSNTISVGGSTSTYVFSSTCPVNISLSSVNFYYRIYAVASTTNAYSPSGGGYYTVPIAGPKIIHSQIQRISPVNRVVVATGTVSDSVGLWYVTMSHWTDSYSTPTVSTITIPNSFKLYNFQFATSARSDANIFYYYLKTVSTSSDTIQTSIYTVPISSSITQGIASTGGTITLYNGDQTKGNTSLVVPQGALSALTNITIEELSPTDTSVPYRENIKPLSAFKFTPEGLRFDKNVTLNIYYPNVNWTDAQKNNLKIMWWDGFDWRVVGGTVNIQTNIVTAYITHFSLYGIFSAPSLSDDDYRPKEKIITPNQDGINDIATFGGLSGDDSVNIFDVRGRKVRKISDTNIWDGKDDSGSFVESGVYVYQIKANGKTISGVIAVAK
ncbi:MAG: gliding motility-associated C-terminal domain-containing protein [Elusimicrobia bacterium]|nr:gliding motility-associated C-terminal domain-containing protein [Elusimicrobiota bacterium]